MTCPSCQRENPEDAVFCSGCGSHLARADREAERRQLTVMFCDLVGSTPLSSRLDPEEFRDLVGAYQRLCGEVISRYDGHVAKYLGDGVLIYFGYPQAHEDDPVRAVRAALKLLTRVPGLNAGLLERISAIRDRPVAVRIGIHTGLVVVGEMGEGSAREAQALGDTPNLAARLQQIAEPNSVVMSEATRRLVAGSFVSEDLGVHFLKGFAEPLHAHRPVQASGVRDRLERVASTRLSPLMGRERELALLLECRDQVKQGRGQVVLLGGEAGIGKSRLVQSLRRDTSGSPVLWLEGRCSPYHENTAFQPLITALEEELDLGHTSGPSEDSTAERLAAVFESTNLDSREMIPLLADLLGLPIPECYALRPESPEARRRHTLDALLAWLQDASERAPIVLVVEDLHWADPSTIEALGRLTEIRAALRVLYLFTFRDSFEPPWAESDGITRITLEPLGPEEGRAMVNSLAEGRPLPGDLRELVVSKADGIPLFIEELAKSLLESDWSSSGPAPEIPATLQGSLMARLDRLGGGKELAQYASVLGREVSPGLLAEISSLDSASLQHRLDLLVQADLLLEPTNTGRSEYVFKHALIQQTAYGSLLRSRRRTIHARIVEILDERGDAQPELMAHHCERAERYEAAVPHLLRAGQKAMRRSAHPEALSHFGHGLELVGRLSGGRARNELELSLQIAIGAPLASTRGYGHADVARAHFRARELSHEIGPGPQLYQALGMLYLFHAAHADMKTASELTTQILDLGLRSANRFVQLFGEVFSGVTRFYEGRFLDAVANFDRALDIEPRCPERPEWYVGEHEPTVVVRSYRSMTLAVIGQLEEAVAMSERAIELGRRSNEPFNLGFALSYGALTHQLRRDPERVLRLADEGVDLCEAQGFPEFLALSRMLRGWALAQLGGVAEGIAELRSGMALGSETGTVIEAPRAFALLAEAQSHSPHHEEALGTVQAGLAIAHRNGNTYWDAELSRLEGVIRLQVDPAAREAAAASLIKASRIARAQGASLLAQRVRHSMELHRITPS